MKCLFTTGPKPHVEAGGALSPKGGLVLEPDDFDFPAISVFACIFPALRVGTVRARFPAAVRSQVYTCLFSWATQLPLGTQMYVMFDPVEYRHGEAQLRAQNYPVWIT